MAWFAAALPYIAAAGAAVSAAGTIAQGNAQAAALRFNAQQQQRASEADAAQVAQNVRRAQGQQRAQFAAAGVDLEGTPTAAASDLASQGELARQLTLYRGTTAAAGLSFAATQVQRAGTVGAFTTLLGGARAFSGYPTGATSGLGAPTTYQPPSPASYPSTGSY